MLRSLFVIVLFLSSAPVALAQQDPLADFADPVGQLNRLVERVPDDERADLMIGRALIETEPAPAALEAFRNVSLDVNLLVPGDAEWDAALAWATGEKQKAALEAFVEATDRRARNTFALPYGEAAPADLRAGGFGVELVDGKLYKTEGHYFDLLERLHTLVWVEANRLAEAGEGMEAAELLVSSVRLGRMLADRPLLEEATLGYVVMLDSCERLRDLVYRYPELLDARDTKRVGRLLEDRTLRLDRLLFPRGGEIAVKQAILDSFERMGDPNASAIAGIVTEAELPVDSPGAGHAGYFETVDVAERVFADWGLRWPLDPYDIVMDRPSYYISLFEDAKKHALVLAVADPHDILFELRMRLHAALSGTKLALGVVAYANDFGSLPKPLVAIRPAYVSEIDVDPFDPLQADQMRYFVPIRDQDWGERETPHPHTIRVHVGIEEQGLITLAGKAGLRRLSDDVAVESMRAFTASVTGKGIEPRNLNTKLMQMDESTLQSLVPQHLRQLTEGLERDAMLLFARVIVGTTLVTPDFAELKEAWGESPNDGSRRRRRSRRQSEPSRELVATARFFAVALNEVGTPLARRLQREQQGDPSVAMFDVTLDQDDFVIYSVGENTAFEWAEESGLDGTDILYWPPLLSLYREHTGG